MSVGSQGFAPDRLGGSVLGEVAAVDVQMPQQTFDRLWRMSGASDRLLQVVLSTGVALLLHLHTAEEEVTIGTLPFDGGDHEEPGFVVLQVHIEPERTVRELLQVMRETAIAAVPGAASADLFDVGVALAGVRATRMLERLPLGVCFSFERGDGGLTTRVRYDASRYDRNTVERITFRLHALLGAAMAAVDTQVADLDLLSPEERQLVLHDFNDTAVPCPDTTIVALFERQLAETPDRVAIVDGARCLSYRELGDVADRVASHLVQSGIGHGDVVAVLADRSAEMVAALLGIFKAGAAYLPIDPTDPAERISFVLGDSRPRAVVSQGRHLHHATGPCPKVELEAVLRGPCQPCPDRSRPRDLAYVIYTSGTTGVPKGVMIAHESVVNRLLWFQAAYPMAADDVLLQKTSYTFDVSVWELFWWVLAGARLCLLEPGAERDPAAIAAAIGANGVTHAHFVPSMLGLFLEHIRRTGQRPEEVRSLRHVFCSGEALDAGLVEQFGTCLHEPLGTRLTNLYGPTETTIEVSHYPCDFGRLQDPVPIGRPIANAALYVVEPARPWRVQPLGVPGELCIGGLPVGRGYLNRDQLTRERFVPNPFRPGTTMYRTGDIARWLADGNVQFLGRRDRQVKVRGYRIELDEIEHHLRAIPGLQDAVVTVADVGAGPTLRAYYVSPGEIDERSVRDALACRLPAYMIPARCLRLPVLPRGASGKVDFRSLPHPRGEQTAASTSPLAQGLELESALRFVWAEVLGRNGDDIASTDSFFQLGGDSYRLLAVNQRVNELTGLEIPLVDMYRFPTIAALCAQVTAPAGGRTPADNQPDAAADLLTETIALLED